MLLVSVWDVLTKQFIAYFSYYLRVPHESTTYFISFLLIFLLYAGVTWVTYLFDFDFDLLSTMLLTKN